MGYTHYFYRVVTLDPAIFRAFAHDCALVAARSDIPLAGWDGTGPPVFNHEEVTFNGVEACGHTARNLGIMWPASDAHGVHIYAPQTGTWFAGALVSQRTCDGDCSHETFQLGRVQQPARFDRDQVRPFACCKTAYKPYDVVVTACLIIAKHHFSDAITIRSDGESDSWEDGRKICQHVLGYGANFILDDNEKNA